MKQIMESRVLPDVQVERIVGPILTIFIEEVLSTSLQNDNELSGQMKLVCQEFPLKNIPDNRTTNIDWLMFNKTRKQILFVELKTSYSKINKWSEQNKKYHHRKEMISIRGGAFLLDDLGKLKKTQYRYVEDVKIAPYKDEIKKCRDAKIIYLVPNKIKQKVENELHVDKVLTFKNLPEEISGPHVKEWKLIRRYLCEFDEPVTYLDKNNRETISHVNYIERNIDFDTIKEKCITHGSLIVIGFYGGISELIKCPLEKIKKRKYKWDNSDFGVGTKIPKNWIQGDVFLKIINAKVKNEFE